MLKTIVFALIAIFFGVSGVWYTLTSNLDFGDFLVWVIAVAACIYALFHRQIDAFTASGFGFACKMLFLAGCALFAVVLAVIIWGQFGNKVSGKEEIMVVLGCTVIEQAPSAVLKYRLDTAYNYYVEHSELTIVVTGGQGANESAAEAQVMAQYLIEKGIPAAQIIIEDQSHSTEENFRFAKILLEENGFLMTEDTEIIYVTNGFHCARAGWYAQNEGFATANALPAGMPMTQIVTCYLHEVFAVVYYAVFKSPNTGFLKNYVGLLSIFGK